MLCDRCKKRPATVHFTKIINSEKYEQHLCEECSREVPNFAFGSDLGFSLNKFLANLLNYDPALSGVGMGFKPERCENCGLTYSQFTQGGKLGCSRCYQVFSNKLDPLLKRIHSSGFHKGKVPARAGSRLKLQREIQNLKDELNNLVAREEFENAAQVRDKIKELEKQLAGGGGK